MIGETPPIVEGGGPSSGALNTHGNYPHNRSTQHNTQARVPVTEVVLSNNGVSRFQPAYNQEDDESNINSDADEDEEAEEI